MEVSSLIVTIQTSTKSNMCSNQEDVLYSIDETLRSLIGFRKDQIGTAVFQIMYSYRGRDNQVQTAQYVAVYTTCHHMLTLVAGLRLALTVPVSIPSVIGMAPTSLTLFGTRMPKRSCVCSLPTICACCLCSSHPPAFNPVQASIVGDRPGLPKLSNTNSASVYQSILQVYFEKLWGKHMCSVRCSLDGTHSFGSARVWHQQTFRH